MSEHLRAVVPILFEAKAGIYRSWPPVSCMFSFQPLPILSAVLLALRMQPSACLCAPDLFDLYFEFLVQARTFGCTALNS